MLFALYRIPAIRHKMFAKIIPRRRTKPLMTIGTMEWTPAGKEKFKPADI